MALLEVEHLTCAYPTRHGWGPPVLRDVNFSVLPGECAGLVGESGSGKTTIGRVVMKLLGAQSGQVRFEGKDIIPLTEKEFRPIRKEIQMVFQHPYGSMNPRMSVGEILSEPLEIHFRDVGRSERIARAAAALEKVGLPADSLRRYPHEFSGGQRQRICIARALSVEPKLIVLDEPVSALDVSVQAQIINLLQDLQEGSGVAYLLIAHDIAVVQHISRHIHVLQNGEIVESGPADEVCMRPKHEYTKSLLDAVPVM